MTIFQGLTDKQLQIQHKAVLELTALLENGIRIGINMRRFRPLMSKTKRIREVIESEYLRRHPDGAKLWKRNFQEAGMNLIEQREKKRNVKTPAGVPEIDAMFDELKSVIGKRA